ncbi:hypothetical protein [Ruegeria sp. PrR005]|uniref:Uncharacterized protein n=1 Tax=Ruegeria sp. PrR005 TaxID=2706882 RepID=A0A6B2NVI2_9RHOB|nr:hypothetical protein [Ruegeria sp. PrR005]NDW46637.1 hypothetical protein [Ruegeria sp. PrR005]
MSEKALYEPLSAGDPLFSGYRFRTGDPGGPQTEGLGLGLGGENGLQPGDPVALDQHYVRAVAFTREASGKVSWFNSLFSAQASGKSVGVLQEAKSFMVGTVDGQQVEIGVAVLLKIEATSFKSEAQVSVANIAAEAQLGLSRAEMEISVRGYTGALGDMLPAPSEVDLTSYTTYLNAFERIQKHVFGPGGAAQYSPVVLGKLRAGAGGD